MRGVNGMEGGGTGGRTRCAATLGALLVLWGTAACEAPDAAEGSPLPQAAVSPGGQAEGEAYHRPGDIKFPPIRGDESLVTGPSGVDEILDLTSAGSSPFWNPATSRITFSAGGGLASVEADGGGLERLQVELGSSGFFLTPQHPDYSPDGTWLSYISDKSGTPELWLWSEENGRDLQLTDLGFEEINAYSWAPGGEWIAFSGNRHGNFDIWKVAVPGGEIHRLTSDPLFEVYPTWDPGGDEILYVRLDERWVDHDVMRIGSDGTNPRIVVRDTDFFDYGYGRTFGHPLVSPDGERTAIRSHRSGWINYWIVDSDGGEPRAIHAQDADQSDGEWSPDGRWFAFTANRNGTHDLRIAPAEGGEARVLVDPGTGVVSSPRWSPDGTEIVYALQSPTLPGELHVVTVPDGASRPLVPAEVEASVRGRLVEPEKITYPSTDGLTIPAYLYRPTTIDPDQRLPGILWIHGGPTSQWNDAFDAHVQFLVQEGYVVLMPNIRGSSGYGKSFEELNEGCWGHCDLEDVVAGVEYLKTLPYIDADNMGIYGASYGGIMSMAAAAFAPGVFQASIPHGGYGDWIDFYHGHNELRHIKLLEHDLGPFDEAEDVWRRSSSIYAVADITTPMLLVQGAGRYPVYRQTYDFALALQRHQKPFRYNIYYGENYYVGTRENRRQFWLDMLKFLDQQLKDPVVAAP